MAAVPRILLQTSRLALCRHNTIQRPGTYNSARYFHLTARALAADYEVSYTWVIPTSAEAYALSFLLEKGYLKGEQLTQNVYTDCENPQSFAKIVRDCIKIVRDCDRLFTQKHEWVQQEGNIGIVGISAYAQEALGDVVYAQLPDIGVEVKQKDECGALESVKAASEIYSPVSGKIVDKNSAVEESPSLINTSCYDKGWLFKVELSNPPELQDLMSEEKYKEFLKSEEAH